MDAEEFAISSKQFLLFKEERTSVIKPLAVDSQEGTGSMGDDTALAVMSKIHRQIYDYFRQQFAQVTNPPIDSLREKSVMSLETCIGPELNIFSETAAHANRIVVNSPILSHKKFNLLIKNTKFKVDRLALEYSREFGLKEALDSFLQELERKIHTGSSIIVLDEKQSASKNT